MQDDRLALRIVGWCGVAVGAVLVVFCKPIGDWLLDVTGPHTIPDYMWPVRYVARIGLLGIFLVVASLLVLWLRRRLVRPREWR